MLELFLAARRIPPHRLPGKVMGRLVREVSARVRRLQVLGAPGELSDAAFRQALRAPYANLSADALAQHFRTRTQPRFLLDAARIAEDADWLRRQRPDLANRVVAAAATLCSGTYDLLGSGPTHLGPAPDWHADFVSGHRWPRAYFKDLDYLRLEESCDVKVPWELSRCQHWVTLGRAYALMGDSYCAELCAGQFRSWLRANPSHRSVNWGNAMEVAIRAVNWLWAFHLFQDAPEFSVNDRWRMLKSLLQHARYVWDYCECAGSLVNGNHCLAGAVGMAFLGILLPEYREAHRWRDRGLHILWEEMPRQVYPDGVDFEQGIGYHGLVLEFYYTIVALCAANAIPIPSEVRQRLERMFEFVLAYTRPDGRFPQIGDDDDGRLQQLDDEAPGSHVRHLGVGAVMFERSDFLLAARGSVETALWLFGPTMLDRLASFPLSQHSLATSRAFPDGGFYILRQEDDYLIVDAGELGMRGIGGHGHNDILSFELCCGGQPFVVDAGTYAYSRSPSDRNRFRGTASHNVVQADGAEIARLGRGRFLWLISDDAHPTVHAWLSSDEFDLFDGGHDGYQRLAEPVACRRRVLFDKRRRIFLVEDRLGGRGAHSFDLRLHLAPGVSVEREGLSVMLVNAEARLCVVPLIVDDLELIVEEDWVSLGYGQRQRGAVLRYRRHGTLPAGFRTAFIPLPKERRAEGAPLHPHLPWLEDSRRRNLEWTVALLDRVTEPRL